MDRLATQHKEYEKELSVISNNHGEHHSFCDGKPPVPAQFAKATLKRKGSSMQTDFNDVQAVNKMINLAGLDPKPSGGRSRRNAFMVKPVGEREIPL